MERWLDWPAFGFLALVTLLDGLRRVPAGALVLRKVVGGKWQVIESREGYRIVSWWPPLTTTLVLPPGSGKPGGEVGPTVATMRGWVTVTTVLGGLSLLSLVVVVPVAMRWWGGLGFLAALAAVLTLAVAVAAVSFLAGGKLGLTTRHRLLSALPRLNPFAAPAGGEALLERAVQGAEPLAVALFFLGRDEFNRWIRPVAYDVARGRAVEKGDALLALLGREQVAALATARPAGVTGGRWCPRCGSEFGATATSCPGCEVPLTIAG